MLSPRQTKINCWNDLVFSFEDIRDKVSASDNNYFQQITI
jgi:hypothetical protein